MSVNNLSTNPFDPNSLLNTTNPGMNPISRVSPRDKKKLGYLLAHKFYIETISRYVYTNLPEEIPQDWIERVLYFRTKGYFFKYLDSFYFLPFTLTSADSASIDYMGRYKQVTPVMWNGMYEETKKNKKNPETLFLPSSVTNVKFTVKYNKKQESSEHQGVILTDSTLEISEDLSSMATSITPLIEQQTDILVLVNIDLVNSATVFYVVSKDPAQNDAIKKEFSNLDDTILNGNRIVVLNSPFELQQLNKTENRDSARYFQSFQSIENIKKSIIGYPNGGTFMKQEHQTNKETETNSSNADAVLSNGLAMRQRFCDLINHFFGLNVSVSLSDSTTEEKEEVAPQGSQTKQIEGDEQ